MKAEPSTLSHYLEHLQSRGKYTFLRSEAIATLKLTNNAFKQAAHRLKQKKQLKQIRGDFYMIIPLEHQVAGSPPPSWFIDDFMQHLNQPYYCGLLTAASLLGAAHQQPMVFQVVTTKQMRPIKAGRLRIQFIYKKMIKPHFYHQVKTTSGYMNSATPEMTAFDLVKYMHAAGHVHNVATVLCELASELNPKKLAQFVERKDVKLTTAQRLGYLLDYLKLSVNLKPLEKVLKTKKTYPRLLVTDIDQPILEQNRRWHILVNEIVEPDEL